MKAANTIQQEILRVRHREDKRKLTGIVWHGEITHPLHWILSKESVRLQNTYPAVYPNARLWPVNQFSLRGIFGSGIEADERIFASEID